MRMLSFEEMRAIYERTEIVRRPTYGIISGYHELPYVCLGVTGEWEDETLVVRGKVQVSPRFIIRPEHLGPDYAEIFGEENVDAQLTGRVFGFLGFRGRPVECTSDELDVKRLKEPLDDMLNKVVDDLERNENISTGVIVTPSSRFYPVSVERFIATVLEDEFSV
ncbi:MAG: hypothetical protein ACF8XB_05490 [Planctomycetota bacterium JB042]